MTAANFHVASDAAIVILIVQVLIVTAVLATITEIVAEPRLTADVNVPTQSKSSLLADAETILSLVLILYVDLLLTKSRPERQCSSGQSSYTPSQCPHFQGRSLHISVARAGLQLDH